MDNQTPRCVATTHQRYPTEWTVFDRKLEKYRLRGLTFTEAVQQAQIINQREG